MIVLVINVMSVFIGKAKEYAPIAGNFDSPKSFQISKKLMKPQSRRIHVLRRFRRLKTVKNACEPPGMFWLNP